MPILNERAVGVTSEPAQPTALRDEPLYTRYCAAPSPSHPISEPRLIHTLMVATWLGRLIDPLPHRTPRNTP